MLKQMSSRYNTKISPKVQTKNPGILRGLTNFVNNAKQAVTKVVNTAVTAVQAKAVGAIKTISKIQTKVTTTIVNTAVAVTNNIKTGLTTVKDMEVNAS